MATTARNSDERQDLIVNIIAWSIGGIILIVFILGAFFKTALGPADAAFLYNRLHPMKIWDIIGVILFIVSLLWITGAGAEIAKRTAFKWDDVIFQERYSAPNTSTWSWVAVGAFLLSLLLMLA
jgi:hypothetical protein